MIGRFLALIVLLLFFAAGTYGQQKIALTPSQLKKELAKPETPPLTKLPLSELDVLLNPPASPPKEVGTRLISAAYQAKWVQSASGDSFLTGKGEWKIAHRASTTSWLPVEPMQLALKEATWKEGQRAEFHLAESNLGNQLSLAVEKEGSLHFNWSYNGQADPGEIRFDLQVPAAPVAIFELDTPADSRPYPLQEILIDGPVPQPDGQLRWRMVFGGQNRLAFSIRKIGPPQSVLIRSRLNAVQTFRTNQVMNDYDFDLDISRSGVTELVLIHDVRQIVRQIQINNLLDWTIEDIKDTADKRIRIRLNEPIRGGRLQVRTASPLPSEGVTWTSPSLRIENGLCLAEKLEFRAISNWKPEAVQPGTFRAADKWLNGSDGTQSLMLESALPAVGKNLTRPRLQLRPRAGEFSAEQILECSIQKERATLRQQIQLQVKFGSVSQLAVEIPKDWEVERVEIAGSDLPPEWQVRGTDLIIEPLRGWIPGSLAKIEVGYRRRLQLQEDFQLPIPWPRIRSAVDVQTRLNWKLPVGWSASLDFPVLSYSSPFLKALESATPQMGKRTELTAHIQKLQAFPSPTGRTSRPNATLQEPNWKAESLDCSIESGRTVRCKLASKILLQNSQDYWAPLVIPRRFELQEVLIAGRNAPMQFAENGDWLIELPRPSLNPQLDLELTYRLPLQTKFFHLECSQLVPENLLGDCPIKWELPEHWILRSQKPGDGRTALKGTFKFYRQQQLVLLALVVLALLTLVRFLVTTSPRNSPPPAKVAAGSLLLLAVIWFTGGLSAGQPPDNIRIWVVSETEGKFAYVPTEYLENLKKPKPDSSTNLIVTEAEYVGAVHESSAEFILDWKLQTRKDELTYRFALPDARLRSVMIDGQIGYPRALGSDKYEVDLKTAGEHRLVVTVETPVLENGSDSEIRFGIPELPQARVKLFLPPSAQQARVINPRGEQTINFSILGRVLVADLGRVRTIHFRWSSQNPNRKIDFYEIHRLEIETGTIALQSAWQFDVKNGSIQQLSLNIPEQWLISRVEVRPDGVLNPLPNSSIKDWTQNPEVKNGFRELKVDLQNSLSGKFRLLVDMVPAKLPTQQLSIHWPVSLEGYPSSTHYCYRQTGWDKVTLQEPQKFLEIPSELYWRESARTLFGPSVLTPPDRTFQRIGTDNPTMKILLKSDR